MDKRGTLPHEARHGVRVHGVEASGVDESLLSSNFVANDLQLRPSFGCLSDEFPMNNPFSMAFRMYI